MPETLSFEETHRYDFPVDTFGSGVGMTICLFRGDPALAFVTQTPESDEVVYLNPGFDQEMGRAPTPPAWNVITGLGYNPIDKLIWCSQAGDLHRMHVFSFDPGTGTAVAAVDCSVGQNMNRPAGFATNGVVLVRALDAIIELRTMTGAKLGERSYPDRNIKAISASPWSWTFGDSASHEIVVIDPFGDIVATAPAPGPPAGVQFPWEGIHALAFDTVQDMSHQPQVWLKPGVIGDPNTKHHPDTDWRPEPWGFRHRIYVANATDQTIYAGYLTQ